jgi:hypothetical protein
VTDRSALDEIEVTEEMIEAGAALLMSRVPKTVIGDYVARRLHSLMERADPSGMGDDWDGLTEHEMAMFEYCARDLTEYFLGLLGRHDANDTVIPKSDHTGSRSK